MKPIVQSHSDETGKERVFVTLTFRGEKCSPQELQQLWRGVRERMQLN